MASHVTMVNNQPISGTNNRIPTRGIPNKSGNRMPVVHATASTRAVGTTSFIQRAGVELLASLPGNSL